MDLERRVRFTAIGGGDEHRMDCQHQYVFACCSDHHGFIPHHPAQRVDTMVEKGIMDFGLRTSDCEKTDPRGAKWVWKIF
jgi:hypothetical protein